MIERLNKNTKIKIISLLSAIVLWMYVMAVVDPEDTKLFQEIPITITNIHEINDLGLVVDPDEELVASVYVKGNLSDLQKITANNINVYGTVNNPIEGQNQLYLRASASDKVSTDFKSDTIVINLEKSIEKEQKINVEITGQYKDDVDTITLSEKNVMVSGPRSRVESIKYVQAVFNADKKLSKTQSTQLELKALDADRKEVNHVTLAFDKVSAEVSYLQQKEVKINVVFRGNSSKLVEGEDFTITPSTIQIKGKSEDLKSIDSIDTEPINVDELTSNNKVIDLKIPSGISSDRTSITIKSASTNEATSSVFTYSGSELTLENNADNKTLEDFDLPETIKVTVEYDREAEKISKSDLKLYLDLSGGFNSGSQYNINHSGVNVKSISIEPSYVMSK